MNIFDEDNHSMNTEGLDRMLDVGTAYNSASLSRADPGTCFDVRVASGKLGLILEEVSEDDVPMVHAVKSGSPLEGKVQKGDRLCSLDGIDCTGKSPHSVGQLLKYREKASNRILTFSRPYGGRR